MNGSTSYETAAGYFPEGLRRLLSGIRYDELKGLTEIRMRAGGPVYFVFPGRISYLLDNGSISPKYQDNVYKASCRDINETVERLCHYSIHSCGRQLTEGCFVIEKGIRVGVSGIYSFADRPQLFEFSSLNFRIPRCVPCCADSILADTLDGNVMICGGVNSGKTTVLRELCRLNGGFRKVTLIDERNEIACVYDGIPQNDVGHLTDVIVNTKRSFGIMSAVRTLSPDVVCCDEIASQEDAEAILNGIGCGVRFIVTAHGSSMKELVNRREIACLIDSGMFGAVCFLHGASKPSVVREIVRYGNVH